MLFLAACDGGPGSPAMAPFLADPSPRRSWRGSRRSTSSTAHALRLVEKTGGFRVFVKSELPRELAARLGMRAVSDIAAVLDRWREEDPHDTVGLIAGPVVYPKRRG